MNVPLCMLVALPAIPYKKYTYGCMYICIFQESHSCIQMDSYNLVYTKTIRSGVH